MLPESFPEGARGVPERSQQGPADNPGNKPNEELVDEEPTETIDVGWEQPQQRFVVLAQEWIEMVLEEVGWERPLSI